MTTTTKENTINFTLPVLYGVFQSHLPRFRLNVARPVVFCSCLEKSTAFNRFYTLSDEYRWYEHLSSLLSYPHLVSYHRNAMHLHLQFIRSLFCTSFFPYNFLLFSHGISFFFNYLSVSFPFIIQFIVIYCLLDIHLSSPLTATTRNQTTTLTVLCTSL